MASVNHNAADLHKLPHYSHHTLPTGNKSLRKMSVHQFHVGARRQVITNEVEVTRTRLILLSASAYNLKEKVKLEHLHLRRKCEITAVISQTFEFVPECLESLCFYCMERQAHTRYDKRHLDQGFGLFDITNLSFHRLVHMGLQELMTVWFLYKCEMQWVLRNDVHKRKQKKVRICCYILFQDYSNTEKNMKHIKYNSRKMYSNLDYALS